MPAASRHKICTNVNGLSYTVPNIFFSMLCIPARTHSPAGIAMIKSFPIFFIFISRIIVGDNDTLEQVKKQLDKLEDVIKVIDLKNGNSVYRELVLIKVKADAEKRAAINEIVTIFRSKIIDVSVDTLTIELTGDESKISAFA